MSKGMTGRSEVRSNNEVIFSIIELHIFLMCEVEELLLSDWQCIGVEVDVECLGGSCDKSNCEKFVHGFFN